jgi:hypothetical protein
VFSSIVLPPELVPRPLSVTVTDAGVSVHVYRRTSATQNSQQQQLLPTKQLFQFGGSGSFNGFPKPLSESSVDP